MITDGRMKSRLKKFLYKLNIKSAAPNTHDHIAMLHEAMAAGSYGRPNQILVSPRMLTVLKNVGFD